MDVWACECVNIPRAGRESCCTSERQHLSTSTRQHSASPTRVERARWLREPRAGYGWAMRKRSDASSPLGFIRPAVRVMAGYTPGEQPQGGGFIKLNTNENPYAPSPRVREAIAACATDEIRLYPDPMADALRDAAAARYDLPRDHILAGNGSDELLAIVLRACTDAGDRVAYPTPTYSLY